jgi:hypothetical protein
VAVFDFRIGFITPLRQQLAHRLASEWECLLASFLNVNEQRVLNKRLRRICYLSNQRDISDEKPEADTSSDGY